ncbi:hypothetical protein ZIOFF_075708 [Zingiber officinale]|uniref:Uncharacterized protein n=1 Tax=Zingiber officinale TaxID=94328 RepID=A0A8J5CPZ1_ZINOF|nr:hypothetical protein ZIOFF_075708 [Zingiber officinale]
MRSDQSMARSCHLTSLEIAKKTPLSVVVGPGAEGSEEVVVEPQIHHIAAAELLTIETLDARDEQRISLSRPKALLRKRKERTLIGESASDIVSLIPSFDCLLAGFRVEAVAFSGGIWLFWEASKVNLEYMEAHIRKKGKALPFVQLFASSLRSALRLFPSFSSSPLPFVQLFASSLRSALRLFPSFSSSPLPFVQLFAPNYKTSPTALPIVGRCRIAREIELESAKSIDYSLLSHSHEPRVSL